MKRNRISSKLLNHHKRLRLFLSVGIVLCLTMLNIYWLYTYQNIWSFLFIQSTIITVLSIAYLLDWYKISENPKYVSWNKRGIKIVSLRDKEEFIKWKDVEKIKQINDVTNLDLLNRKFPDYVLVVNGKLNSFRYLEPKIAKQLMKAWREYGDLPLTGYRPPGEE